MKSKDVEVHVLAVLAQIGVEALHQGAVLGVADLVEEDDGALDVVRLGEVALGDGAAMLSGSGGP
jgi:hypothetical protein